MTTPDFKLLFAGAALAVSALTLAPAALAAGTAEIEYRDLDLATDAGKAALSQRIDVAARRICRAGTRTGSRIASRDGLDACIADVRRQVETRLAAATGGESRGR